MRRSPGEGVGFATDVVEEAVVRLHEALALLEAVEGGELLSELPIGEDAARRHQRAVSLLAVLKRELVGLAHQLEAANQTRAAVVRVSRARQD
jgi:hypothetical protein